QWTWTVPAGQATGSYRVAIGVFSADWTTLYAWVSQAATVTVQSGGVAPGFTIGTTVAAPNPVTRGIATTITADVTDTGGAASGILIDMEIYAANGSQILQQFAAGQSFRVGRRKTLQWTWTVPAAQATGSYRVAIGVFSAGWTTLYVWVSQAATDRKSVGEGERGVLVGPTVGGSKHVTRGVATTVTTDHAETARD